MATAPRKTAVKKAPAKKAPARAAAPRKTPKHIRNLRGTAVHLRLLSGASEKPFRIQLTARGQVGDTSSVPVALLDDPTFLSGIDVLFEIITASEAKELQNGYGPVGYTRRADAPKVIRPEDTTILSVEDWDGKGRLPEDRDGRGRQVPQTRGRTGETVGMNLVNLPGSDTGLHALLSEGNAALPPDVRLDGGRLPIERVKE